MSTHDPRPVDGQEFMDIMTRLCEDVEELTDVSRKLGAAIVALNKTMTSLDEKSVRPTGLVDLFRAINNIVPSGKRGR